jgi:hypothetical protein
MADQASKDSLAVSGGGDETKRKPSGMNPERLKELQKQADAVRIGGKGTARRKKKVSLIASVIGWPISRLID